MRAWQSASSPAQLSVQLANGHQTCPVTGADNKMSGETTEGCLTPLAFRDTHIEPHEIPLRTFQNSCNESSGTPSAGGLLRGGITPSPLAGMQHGAANLQRLRLCLLRHTAVLQPSNCTPGHLAQEMKTSAQIHARECLLVSFVIVQTWKEPECPSVSEWLKHPVVCPHRGTLSAL